MDSCIHTTHTHMSITLPLLNRCLAVTAVPLLLHNSSDICTTAASQQCSEQITNTNHVTDPSVLNQL